LFSGLGGNFTCRLYEMTKKPRCIWIVDSGIRVSETFLIQSLENLRQIFDVTAVSGGRKTNNSVSGVRYTSFARKRITLWHTIFRKVTGVDLIAKTKQRRARNVIQKQQRIHPINVAWIHFGTTAVLVYKELKTQRIPYFIQVHGVDVTSHFSSKPYKASSPWPTSGFSSIIVPPFFFFLLPFISPSVRSRAQR